MIGNAELPLDFACVRGCTRSSVRGTRFVSLTVKNLDRQKVLMGRDALHKAKLVSRDYSTKLAFSLIHIDHFFVMQARAALGMWRRHVLQDGACRTLSKAAYTEPTPISSVLAICLIPIPFPRSSLTDVFTASLSFDGRPILIPWLRARFCPAKMRSRISSRSYSPSAEKMPNTMRPDGVVVSIAC